MSALPLESARLSKLRTPFQNHLLNGDLCKHFFDFHIFSYFLAFNHDFIIYINYTHIAASNTASDDVTIRSHVEYLIHTYSILVLDLYSKR